MKKTIVYLLTVCCMFTGLPVDGILAAAAPDRELPFLSSQLGFIAEHRLKPDAPLVIHIQDLHCNPEAQTNINKLISLYSTRYPGSRILVEGAPRGPVNLGALRAIPDSVRSRTFELMLSKGLMGGAEYNALLDNRDRLYGLEEWAAYEDAVSLYRQLLDLRRSAQRELADFNAFVDETARATLGPDLRPIQWLLLQEDRTDAWYAKLSRVCAARHIPLYRYPALSMYLRKRALGPSIREKAVRRQTVLFLAELKTLLPYRAYAALNKKMDGPDELFALIGGHFGKLPPSTQNKYPDLAAYLAFSSFTRNVNLVTLNDEESALMHDLCGHVPATPRERDTLELLRLSRLLLDGVNARLTAEGFAAFARHKDALRTLLRDAGAFERFPRLTGARMNGVIERYARANLRRDDYFSASIISALNAQGAGGGRPVTIVITGGFHRGIGPALEAKGISYLSVLPTVTTAAEARTYEQLITDSLRPRDAARSALSPVLNAIGMDEGITSSYIAVLSEMAEASQARAPLTAASMADLIRQWIDRCREQATAGGSAEKLNDLSVSVRGDTCLVTGNTVSVRLTFRDGRLAADADEADSDYAGAAGSDPVSHWQGLLLKSRPGLVRQQCTEAVTNAELAKTFAPVPCLLQGKEQRESLFEMPAGELQELRAALGVQSDAEVGALLNKALAEIEELNVPGPLPGILKQRKIRLTLLDENKSRYPFEDHSRDGFIGINRTVLSILNDARAINPGLARAFFVTGIIHELRHESGAVKDDPTVDAQVFHSLLAEYESFIEEWDQVSVDYFVTEESGFIRAVLDEVERQIERAVDLLRTVELKDNVIKKFQQQLFTGRISSKQRERNEARLFKDLVEKEPRYRTVAALAAADPDIAAAYPQIDDMFAQVYIALYDAGYSTAETHMYLQFLADSLDLLCRRLPTPIFKRYYTDRTMSAEHGLSHALDVVRLCVRLARAEKIGDPARMKRLLVAALAHDLACTIHRTNHEENSALWIAEILRAEQQQPIIDSVFEPADIEAITQICRGHGKVQAGSLREEHLRYNEARILHDADLITALSGLERILSIWEKAPATHRLQVFYKPELSVHDRVQLLRRLAVNERDVSFDEMDGLTDLMKQCWNRRDPQRFISSGGQQYIRESGANPQQLIAFFNRGDISARLRKVKRDVVPKGAVADSIATIDERDIQKICAIVIEVFDEYFPPDTEVGEAAGDPLRDAYATVDQVTALHIGLPESGTSRLPYVLAASVEQQKAIPARLLRILPHLLRRGGVVPSPAGPVLTGDQELRRRLERPDVDGTHVLLSAA